MDSNIKTYIFDTSVLIHDPHALDNFKDNHLVIPIAVIEELDKLKKEQYPARETLRQIDRYCEKGDIEQGVPLDGGGTLRIDVSLKQSPSNRMSADDRIIETALRIKREIKDSEPVIVVSKDTAVRIKAGALKVDAQDYKSDKTSIFQHYGKVLPLGSGHTDGIESIRYMTNEREIHRLYGKDGNTMIHRRDRIYGLSFKNIEQECAADALLSDEISMVALTGKAGAGKTLLALAAGLQQYDKRKYEQVVVARPIIPMGKDLGFIPGDIKEKLSPWMQPIFDNLEVLLYSNREGRDGRDTDPRRGRTRTVRQLIESEAVHIEPLTYIRGRSLPSRFIIIDEAQNLRPIDALTIVTRAGEGTKMVFTGDLSQIDSPYLDSESNGLAFLISRFINEQDFCYLNLTISARSHLAERAAELLKLR